MDKEQKLPMDCLDDLHKIENKIREVDTKTTFNKMLSSVDNLRTTMTLIISQLNPLEADIKESIKDEQFIQKVDVAYNGLSIKINFQLQQSFNLTYSYSLLVNEFAKCIKALIKIIDDLYSEKEDKVSREINPLEEVEQQVQEVIKESTPPEPNPLPPPNPPTPLLPLVPTNEEIEKENKKVFEPNPELANESEDPEEDEEVAVNISNFIFECEECKNNFKSVNGFGCPNCGKTLFQTKYLN